MGHWPILNKKFSKKFGFWRLFRLIVNIIWNFTWSQFLFKFFSPVQWSLVNRKSNFLEHPLCFKDQIITVYKPPQTLLRNLNFKFEFPASTLHSSLLDIWSRKGCSTWRNAIEWNQNSDFWIKFKVLLAIFWKKV